MLLALLMSVAEVVQSTSKEELALIFTAFALPAALVALVALTIRSSRLIDRVYDTVFDPEQGLQKTMSLMRLRYHDLANFVQGTHGQVQLLSKEMERMTEAVKEVHRELHQRNRAHRAGDPDD